MLATVHHQLLTTYVGSCVVGDYFLSIFSFINCEFKKISFRLLKNLSFLDYIYRFLYIYKLIFTTPGVRLGGNTCQEILLKVRQLY